MYLFIRPLRKPVSRNALKLGGKSKDVDSFVDQLKSEGEKISSLMATSAGGNTAINTAKSKLAMDINVERLIATSTGESSIL